MRVGRADGFCRAKIGAAPPGFPPGNGYHRQIKEGEICVFADRELGFGK